MGLILALCTNVHGNFRAKNTERLLY